MLHPVGLFAYLCSYVRLKIECVRVGLVSLEQGNSLAPISLARHSPIPYDVLQKVQEVIALAFHSSGKLHAYPSRAKAGFICIWCIIHNVEQAHAEQRRSAPRLMLVVLPANRLGVFCGCPIAIERKADPSSLWILSGFYPKGLMAAFRTLTGKVGEALVGRVALCATPRFGPADRTSRWN